MAIVIEQQKAGNSLTTIITTVVIILLVGGASYYLFFAPTPRFDVIIPAPLQKTTQIAEFNIDPSSVLESSAFRALRKYGGVSGTGSFGRPNPFMTFQ